MSEVILDTITGKSTATTITIGSTPVVSASANSMTIRGEGSNQTSIQQGLAKAWVHAHEHDAQDSFNIASQTDTATGDYTFTYTNNFSSVSHCPAASNQSTSNGRGLYVGNLTTSTFRIIPANSSGTKTDYNTSTMLSGDLA